MLPEQINLVAPYCLILLPPLDKVFPDNFDEKRYTGVQDPSKPDIMGTKATSETGNNKSSYFRVKLKRIKFGL